MNAPVNLETVRNKEILATISIVPESAPFNPEQRAWLNGFFAGMTGIDEIAANPQSTAQSELGAEENGISRATAQEDAEEDFPWHDDSLTMDERMELADGRSAPLKMMAAMAQLNCGSCGYLCRSYSEAIANREETNLTLCTPGGKDTARMLKRLVKLNADSPTDSTLTTQPVPVTENSGYSRDNPFEATLIRSEKITGEGSDKDVRHVEIDLTGSNIDYHPGDSLGLYPTNCDELVGQILYSCNVCSDHDAARKNLSTLDLSTVTDALCEHVASLATLNADRQRIEQLMADEDQIDELDVLDFLQLFDSVPISEKQLCDALPELRPRLYSIASSQNKHPRQVHLTVGKVSYTKAKRLRKGVASTLLADRADVGSELRVFVQPSHGFSVPIDDSSPMIMVGPGTGIAPFIAFLQERDARNAKGNNWLFFGDQRSECDFLYREQLASYQDSGLLTKLNTAFSRDQEHKIYVQDRMSKNASELYRLLLGGASFYVCGDASRMA